MVLGKLDRYIIKKYLTTFFFTALVLTLIALAIDTAEKVQTFISEPVTFGQVLMDYTLKFVLHINSLLWPMFALIAVIFFTSRMAYDSEIISILNAGISFRRLLRPYFVAASILTLLLLLANHTIIPQGNRTRLDFEQTYVWKDLDKGKTDNVHLFIGTDTKVFIKRYHKPDSSGTGFRLEKMKNNELTYVLNAKKIEWVGPPGRWKIKDYVARTIDGKQEHLDIRLRKSMDTVINLTPQDFVQYLNEKEQMSTLELSQAIDKQRKRGLGTPKKFEIEIARRTTEPITILILTLIGVSVASRKVRGGMGLHLAIGMGLGAIFIFLSKFSMTFAQSSSLPATLGVWIPNIVFLIIGIFLSMRAQK